MKSFVGTSGWSYDWNEGGDLQWYVTESRLNAVELNASFYRFPLENYVMNWRKRGESLKWSVKVHRSITHNHKFNEHAKEIWTRFRQRFMPLDDLIDFYLFQIHPRFQNVGRIEQFLYNVDLDHRIALEVRDPTMLADDDLCARLQQSAVLVSVDSPDFQNRIFAGDIIYLRMHGREDWYFHDYTTKELRKTVATIRKAKPEVVYVFFNNDHHMIENARTMRRLLDNP